MKNKTIKSTMSITLIILGILGIGGCSTPNTPNSAIEEYLQALADANEVAAVNLSCGDWEEQALAEGASFVNVDVTLENALCQVVEESSDGALVTCEGRFIFSYDAGEDQELDLEGRTFITNLEAGEWRMCGYQ